ncbi:MAG: hypothetical protein ACK54Y_06750 [Bacteroidota bacterium]
MTFSFFGNDFEKPSNKPFEWTGRQLLSASPPQAPCLPLKGSVGLTKATWLDEHLAATYAGLSREISSRN